MTVELISSPPVLAAGNWVWLLAPPRQERALVIAPDQDALAGVISPHFTRVSRIAPEGDGQRLPEPDSSIDLVAISRLEECAPGEIAWLADTVRESRRVLRDGGCMLVTFVNPFWARRYVRGWGPERLVTRGSVLAELEAAGFGRLASYYIQPFPEAASSIIPTWGPAAVQHERMEHMSSALGRYRPFAARIGAHALLYPGCACVGYV
jgi:SAM-dependent methyltransferase